MLKTFIRGALASGATLFALAVTIAPASAQTASGSLPVSATVTANCTVSTSALAFGNVDVTSGLNDDDAGGLSIVCTNGTGWAASAAAAARASPTGA